MAEIVLITGLSGAGRSAAAAVLEDLGWYVVDNLPTSLLPVIVELASKPGGGIDRLALVSGRQHTDVLPHVGVMRTEGHRVTVLFLDATTAELVRRYDATRRRHPLAEESDGLLESIELERERLRPLRDAADLVIDTTDLNVHQLKERVVGAFEDSGGAQLQVAVESFGYKHGLPLDADIVMDVRFLPNPHWQDDLRQLTGHDPAVRDFVLETAVATAFLDRLDDSRRTTPRDAATSRSRSGAPAAGTARWPSRRSSPDGSVSAASQSGPRTATSASDLNSVLVAVFRTGCGRPRRRREVRPKTGRSARDDGRGCRLRCHANALRCSKGPPP
jgi:RNase adapter protein RapZ